MPHKCVKCDTLLVDTAPEVMTGCPCGSKVFMYVREEKLASVMGITENDGKFDLNLGWLFRREANSINSVADGKYEIDLEAVFQNK